MNTSRTHVHLTVNGHAVECASSDTLTLLEFLRDTLGLRGTKNGCAKGHCGACTIIVGGKAQRACLLKMSRLSGAVVETIEGLAKDGVLHPVQQAFIDAGAVSCGFCTPGMIMAVKALLNHNPSPTDDEIKQALKNNLCRCTGYVTIIEAVRRAAAVMRGEAVPAPAVAPGSGIGVSVPRVGVADKVTGRELFAADYVAENMLFGKTLRSEYPHAEILSIDVSKARELPGVVAALTAADIPGLNAFGKITKDQPVLCTDRVRYVGDAVAVVFAESEAIAEQALTLIDVQYRELPGVFSPQDALRPDAPLLHPGGNIHFTREFEAGDVEKGFAEADVIVEQTYTVPFIDHAFLEPEAALSKYTDDGVLTIWTPTQEPFLQRDLIADALALPRHKVRISVTPSGGAFGGRGDITIQALCALGTWATKRPVQMVMTREESQRVRCKRHAEHIVCKTGATKDGRLTAWEAFVLADTGAYASVGLIVISRSVSFGTGPYKVPNVKIKGHAVYTNNPIAGAMRGFGSTQASFYSESQMDIMARKLGIDPYEFRLKNGLDVGDVAAFGETMRDSVGVLPTLRAAKAKLDTLGLPKASRGKRIGVGYASSWKNVGYGYGALDAATAAVELIPAGRILVRVGSVEMGQGTNTAMVQLASEVLGVGCEYIDLQTADTLMSVDADATVASRQTYVSGNAVVEASKKLKEQLLGLVAGEFHIHPSKVVLRGSEFISLESEQKVVSLADLGALAEAKRLRLTAIHYTSVEGTSFLRKKIEQMSSEEAKRFRLHIAYSYATQIAVVEVDETTGEVRVLDVIAAHDCGKAINPASIDAQIQGGIVMGMGYALSEEFRVDNGRILTKTLRDCRIPDITWTPRIIPIIVEDPEPTGPFGAKGVGEMGTNPTAPAIINAIDDAIGVRIADLPATKEKVLRALQEKRAGAA